MTVWNDGNKVKCFQLINRDCEVDIQLCFLITVTTVPYYLQMCFNI